MSTFCPLVDSLPAEHRALCREYAAVQERCSRVMAQQRAEIAQLQAQVLRLRAAAIVQVTALAFACTNPALSLPVGVLVGRVPVPPPPDTPYATLVPGTLAWLEANMAAADLVICQTGCLSHGAYWRDNEHCRRTDKACVLPDVTAATNAVLKTEASPLQESADSYQSR